MSFFVKRFNVLLLCLLFIYQTSMGGLKNKVHSKILDNGMRIFVKVDKRAPLVTQQLWYKVGSADEQSGATGLSHLLEHMMFNGTKKYSGERFTSIVSELGGDINAFTSYDYTTYFETLPADQLETVMALESDRMKNLNITQKSFTKELAVVREERRLRTTDNPQSKFYESYFSAAFANSGYRNPIIGWDEDLVKLDVVITNQWYQQWYSPNNVTMVIVGDVDPKKVFTMAKKYFGSYKKGETNNRQLPEEPPLDHRVEIHMSAENVSPVIIVGHKVPSYLDNTEDSLVLALLSMILSNGESDWLVDQLIFKDKLAVSVDTNYSLEDRGTTLFTISATPAPSVSLAKLEKRISELLKNIPIKIFNKANRIKMYNQLKSQRVFAQDSIFYQAMQIGLPETVGIPWKTYQSLPEKILKITPKKLSQVARKYLSSDNYIIGTLTPK